MCGLKLKRWVTHKSVYNNNNVPRDNDRERERDTKILNAEIGGRGKEKK